ncbi:MAG: hypothetical protein HQM10_25500 [Candidatus Riflebacteria bacterium]|nr:hypothetical protein [Candidatus Riflebacteria bacterium]
MLSLFRRSYFLFCIVFVIFLALGKDWEAFAEKPKDTPAPKKKKSRPKNVSKKTEKPVSKDIKDNEETSDETDESGADDDDGKAAKPDKSGKSDKSKKVAETSESSGTAELEEDLDAHSYAAPGGSAPVLEVRGYNLPVDVSSGSSESAVSPEPPEDEKPEPKNVEGGIHVSSSTPGAKVRVNGLLKGSVNETLKIAETGVCEIEVFAPDYVTHKVTRKIPEGEVLSFDVILQPIGATPVEAPKPTEQTEQKAAKGLAGAWKVEFKGSSKAILRKNSIIEILQNGSSFTMIADTYLPDRSLISTQDWELKEKYRWNGVFENGKVKATAWKGQLQFEATLDATGSFLEGKVNSSANRYHTYVVLRRL